MRNHLIRLAGCAALFFIGCGDDTGDADAAATGGNTGEVQTDEYEPFAVGHLENQVVRVAGYDAIATLRGADDFAATTFGGDCASYSPEVKSPSNTKSIASLYVESASLAAKVEGRKDDHSYNAGAEIGKDIHAAICGAIAAGSAVDAATDKEALNGIAWHAQIVDKGLLHFFYLSVYHELTLGARSKWDEGFGYFGASFDGADAGGLAKTVQKRDGNCGTSYFNDIHESLILGRNALDKALTDAGKTGSDDELDTLPADLSTIVADIDRMLLEVFALSFGREFVGLAAGDKPVIKLIEARMFFRILKPALARYDADNGTTYAADLEAMLEQDDPAQVDTDAALGVINSVWGLDVPTLCK